MDGVPVRWEETGPGTATAVVFIHGIPTSPGLWRDVLSHVKAARCLAFEMVGYGESVPAGRGRDISVARQADYLLGWLEAIGVERAVFVGHDLGGGVAQIAAVRRPESCAGLLLTNAIGYDSWPIPSVKALQGSAGLLERLPPAALRPLLASLILRGHDDLAAARRSYRVHRRQYAAHDGAAALARQVRALDVGDTLAVCGDLARLRVPARVVWGTADRFQKLHYGERLAADLEAPLLRIPGGRHFTPEDHPGIIAAATNDLVRAVERR
ncbi:pimeloyl-ACP methyl ester carboxylesterase [Spinactinospora alkalitolerans]|uniref:Pimeloyl-ACP methyl ester carboxylesterase n=1 Tax=Spinactinospora alkalitolerans TaxID=687207 RepID=A0A852TXX6_9ACTN|nr:alpha/beta fold hydrolase [Spinactinospora alkalitolerans]NYE47812.1 pimeloyl-ACP methyl ester carboxylesterase [Spinactinospora alkalitolerans]